MFFYLSYRPAHLCLSGPKQKWLEHHDLNAPLDFAYSNYEEEEPSILAVVTLVFINLCKILQR